MKFCSDCGQPLASKILPGDHLPRQVCTACGTVHYRNPRIIVGCVVEADDGRVLLGRRNTEPRRDFWTFPTGFLELGETGAAGAARETLEEMLADVEITDLFAVFDVPTAGQVSMLYRGRMKDERHGASSEIAETRLFRADEIPWLELAFLTVRHGLRFFLEDRVAGVRGVHELELVAPFW